MGNGDLGYGKASYESKGEYEPVESKVTIWVEIHPECRFRSEGLEPTVLILDIQTEATFDYEFIVNDRLPFPVEYIGT